MSEFVLKENFDMSAEEFEQIHGRAPIEIRNTPSHNNHYSFGQEVFFGNNVPLVLGIRNNFSKLRKEYNYLREATEPVDIKRSKIRMYRIVDDMKKVIREELNVSNVEFGLMNALNAFCIPVAFDESLVNRSWVKEIFDSKKVIEMNDIVETKNGFRFREGIDVKLIFCFGLGFFLKDKDGNDYTNDDECTAILLHEIGHSFQQILSNVKTQLAMSMSHTTFTMAYRLLNPFTFLLFFIEHAEYKKNSNTSTGSRNAAQIIANNRKNFNRDNYAQELAANTVKTIDSISTSDLAVTTNINSSNVIESLNDSDMKQKYGKGVSSMIKDKLSDSNKSAISVVGSIIIKIFGPIIKLISDILTPYALPNLLYVESEKDFLKRWRTNEEFADSFTSYYGMAGYQASALKKINDLIESPEKMSYGYLSFVNYIPLVSLYLAYMRFLNTNAYALINGYPTTKGRFIAMYKSLKAELKNNKDIDSKTRAQIEESMKQLSDIYDDYVYDWSPKGYIYAFFHKIRFKTIDNDKCDAGDIVINIMKELKDEGRFNPDNFKNISEKSANEEIDNLSKKLFKFDFINAASTFFKIKNEI